MNSVEKNKNIGVINDMNKNYKQFTFDFVSKRKIFFIVVGVVFLLGMASFFVRGFNWDIDFVGGTIMEYNIGRDLSVSDLTDIENLVTEVLGANMVSSVVRSGTPPQQVVIKTTDLNTEQRDAVFQTLAKEYNLTADDIYSATNVNPTVGEALTRSTILSVVIACVLMLIYITFRFNFLSGISMVICLMFDVFVTLTFYSLLHISMNIAVIAAFLTVLGYSMNSAIIIFDRIRENMKLKKGSGMAFSEIVNLSICQTMARSVNTTTTTMLVLLCVYILGVTSIRNFVLPLMVGIGSGLFSSICLAGPLWDFFKRDGKGIKEKAK